MAELCAGFSFVCKPVLSATQSEIQPATQDNRRAVDATPLTGQFQLLHRKTRFGGFLLFQYRNMRGFDSSLQQI